MLVELEKTRTCASPTQVDEDEHFKHWTRINIRANPHALSLTAVVDNTGKKMCSFGHERALCQTKLAYICHSSWLLEFVPPLLPSFSLHATALTPTACLLQVRYRLLWPMQGMTQHEMTIHTNPVKQMANSFQTCHILLGEFLNLVVSNLAVWNFYTKGTLWHCCAPFLRSFTLIFVFLRPTAFRTTAFANFRSLSRTQQKYFRIRTFSAGLGLHPQSSFFQAAPLLI